MSRNVLLVGSISLTDAESVFKEVGSRLKGCAHSVPDGETGKRGNFVAFQALRLRGVDGLEEIGTFRVREGLENQMDVPNFRFADGRAPNTIQLPRLGYDEIAAESYEVFKRARAAGDIPEDMRFQVSLPSPMQLASLIPGSAEDVLPLFEAAIKLDIDGIAEKIPADDLVIQWDMAAETVFEEARRQRDKSLAVFLPPIHPSYTFDVFMDSVARTANLVPDNIKMGIHLCYGSIEGKNLIDAVDTTLITEMANALSERITRPIAYFHMPISHERDDDAFYAPLKGLRLKPGTELNFGLIHHADGLDGAQRRIKLVEKVYSGNFGVSAECGLGRIPRELIPAILDLHRDVAQL